MSTCAASQLKADDPFRAIGAGGFTWLPREKSDVLVKATASAGSTSSRVHMVWYNMYQHVSQEALGCV